MKVESFPCYDERLLRLLTLFSLPVNLTCCSLTVGSTTGMTAEGVSSAGPLVTTSFTLFPHCLRTCATCSLPMPHRSVSPILRMWSPLRRRPSWGREDSVFLFCFWLQMLKKEQVYFSQGQQKKLHTFSSSMPFPLFGYWAVNLFKSFNQIYYIADADWSRLIMMTDIVYWLFHGEWVNIVVSQSGLWMEIKSFISIINNVIQY